MNVDRWHAVGSRIEKLKCRNFEVNVSFAQRNRQRLQAIKMVAFHLFGIRTGTACLLLVLSSGAGLQRSRSGMLGREDNIAPV